MTLDWIAVDWGTTNLRAWAMNRSGEVLGETHSGAGMSSARETGFETALLASISDWLSPGGTTLILAAGMVGARQGWIEAPYCEVPCAGIPADQYTQAPASDSRLDVRILPGLCQSDPADVMRGEETQIFGFLSEDPGFEGAICLPGTHSKWVNVSEGQIFSFQSVMTGELFALLSEASVLQHSITQGWDDSAFLQGVQDGFETPRVLTGMLFEIRAKSLLAKTADGWAAARLSGLLIGAEIAGADIAGKSVALIGGDKLSERYATALKFAGFDPTLHDAGAASRKGLHTAHLSLTGDAR